MKTDEFKMKCSEMNNLNKKINALLDEESDASNEKIPALLEELEKIADPISKNIIKLIDEAKERNTDIEELILCMPANFYRTELRVYYYTKLNVTSFLIEA